MNDINGQPPKNAPIPYGVGQQLLIQVGTMLETNPDWDEFISLIERTLLAGPNVSTADFNKSAPRLREFKAMAEAGRSFLIHFHALRELVRYSNQKESGR